MAETRITVNHNGSISIEGELVVLDAAGNELARRASGKDSVALCRCGGSGNKPFCDGTHLTNGFQSEIRPTA